jgi:hypothetical protein
MTTLNLTYCTGDKREDGQHTPDELYISDRIDRFMETCRENCLEWGILSAEHGVILPDEKHGEYDTTMKSDGYECRFYVEGEPLEEKESRQKFQELASEIDEKLDENGFDRVRFYAPAPQRVKCYLLLLHRAVDGCKEYHETTDEIKDCIRSGKKLEIIKSKDSLN